MNKVVTILSKKGLNLGAELITNGGFDTDTVWTKGTSWTISGGVANFNGDYNLMTQTIGATLNKTFRVQFTVKNWVSGFVQTSVGGFDTTPQRTGNGTYTEIITASNAGSNSLFYFIPQGNRIFSIDDVSVKEIL